MNNKKPAFIVDAMLGKLAKKLRLLGYDSIYSSSMEDEELTHTAKKEDRILITKDAQLAKTSLKQQISTIQITKSDEIEQFLQINEKVSLGKCTINANNSRCPLCNSKLEYIEKNKISENVPRWVLEHTDDFWMCENCKKVYWEGTHIKNLQKFAAKLNDRL